MEGHENTDAEKMREALDTLKTWRDEVNEILSSEFKDHIERAKDIHPEGARIVEFLEKYSMRGGKRIRPACIIAGYKAVGGEEEDKIFSASTSIEALQTYFLIHDDIMDEDDMRRGGPSLHIMYRDIHKENDMVGDPDKFGKNMGIIAGDLANSYAVDQLVKSGFEPERKTEALEKFEEIHRHTGFGQTLDILGNFKNVEEIEEDDVMTVHRLKTAHYTIAGPLELGAILGNGSEKQRNILKKYGMQAGGAFQLYDDMLGLYGDEEKLGKPCDSDLKEGKKTVLILKALENGNEEQREFINYALGNDNLSNEEVDKVRKIVKDTGAYSYSRKKIKNLIEGAKDTVRNADVIDPDMKDFLVGIADYIVTREV